MKGDRITMLIKLPSINSVSKFSAVCALAFSLVLGGANIDTATARDLESLTQAVDRLTDWFFYKVNPQLGGRKLRSDDSPVYIREWNAIRRTVDREMIATAGDCVGDAFWDFEPSKRIALQIQFGLSAIHRVIKLVQMFLNKNGKSFDNQYL
ncbi:MAG: hypothetical protein EAZ60_05780 [Oscillatoriales cyanobacterium]|nr:MAG: hypothetical protein EAZ60_05780 [Oscillatoriales cyanobacterium]